LKLFRKASVAVSPHHITIIKVRLNKAIINFDDNIERELFSYSLNGTNGGSNLFANVFYVAFPT